MSALTQARVRELFDYNPETGVVIRKLTVSKAKKGDVAGYPDPISEYLVVKVDTKKYSLHRIIWLWMTGEFPKFETDHENHIRSDNKWKNLRAVTRLENRRNRPLQKNNKSGAHGVRQANGTGKWRCTIFSHEKEVHLGMFASFDDAVAARKAAEKRYGFHENHGS